MKVDILLAPYEPLTEPAAGETIVAGHPLRIQWDREYTIDTADGIIDAVDLLYSANNWATQDTVVVDADATSGEYLWTPGTEHVAQGGQICAVYRNIYTAHVGSDTLQSVRVGNPTSYPDLVATNTLPAHDNVWPQLAVASNKRGAKIYVNAAQIGWGDAPVSLSDSDGDGTYTYQGPPVAGYEGTYSLPTTIYLANGNKEFYGLAVEVVDGSNWESLAPADLAVFALPKIGGTPTVVATEVGSGAVYEIESVEIDVSPLASEGVPSTWTSLAEDLVVSGSQMAPNIWANDTVTVDGDRSAGFYDLPVRVRDEFGHLYQSSVRVTVVDELIPRFDDKSADTGQLEQLGGAPFSSASLNIGTDLYSMDADDLESEDLFVTIQGAESKLFEMYDSFDRIPQFVSSTEIQGLDDWHGVRGLAVADIDNDGYEDLFLAHDQDPRLYRWDDTAGEFVNATTSLFNPGPPLNSYAAAWGDYNLDGFVDLIVGCSPSAVSQLDPTGQMATAPVLLYRNDGSGVLQQITDTSEFPSVAVAGLSVLWNDVDGDGDQDLFLGDASATGGSRLLINGGPETGFTFTDQTSTWFPAGTGPTRVVAAEFVELTGDGLADLALAHLGASDNLTFYESTGTSYQLVDKQIANLPNIAVGLNGLISGDFDLNGGMDLLLLPYLTTDSPRMFLNGMNSPLGVFARVPAIEGLDLGALNGAAVHDWGDDGDLDLFFGREPAAGLTTADNFFFRSKWSEVDDGPPIDKRYVKIRVVSDLIDDGGTLRRALVNNTGIGTKVSINAGSFDQTQWTSGGNGRGGQNSRTLLFGIGGYPDDTLQATVTWPDGRNTFHLVHVDSTNIIRDDGLFLIDESSIQVNGVAPNADIEFVWNASRPMENLRVLLDPSPGSIGGDQSECYCGTNGFVQIFDETTTGVATSVENLGDGWFRHSLVYDGWCCEPGCEFDYQVSGTSGQETLTSAWYSKSAGTCGVEIRLRNSFE